MMVVPRLESAHLKVKHAGFLHGHNILKFFTFELYNFSEQHIDKAHEAHYPFAHKNQDKEDVLFAKCGNSSWDTKTILYRAGAVS